MSDHRQRTPETEASCDDCAPADAGTGAYDLAVIGSGSAAFAAAIRAVELGARVAIVERGTLGGTCVNVGCVPSKALIRAAEAHYRASHHNFEGVRATVEPPNFGAIVRQKDELVEELRQTKYQSILDDLDAVTLVTGNGELRSDGTLTVDGEPLEASRVLIATGTSAWVPSIPGLRDVPYLTSTEAMELEELPEHLIVIGAGFVGLELGQAFARFGSKVTIIARSRLLSSEDADLSDGLLEQLRQEGLTIHLDSQIERVEGEAGNYRLYLESQGRRHTVEGTELLVAAGRRPNTASMGLQAAGIELGARGEIVVDEHLETTRPGVYAAGDVIGDPAFVYVAAHAGNLVADNAIGGNTRKYDVSVVPGVTFTDPAVATVGLTEAQARATGKKLRISKLPMSYVPRAIAARDTRGFIKLIADADTNLLLGAHILAPEAGDLIQQAVIAMRFGIRVDELASLLFPYLTNAEGIKLAAQTFDKDVAKLSCCAA